MAQTIEQEITAPTIRVKKKDYPIERLPLRKIFRFIHLLQDSLGDIIDKVQGNLPPEVRQRVREAGDDEAKVREIIGEFSGTMDDSVTGIAKLIMSKERRAYEIVALCLDPQVPGHNAEAKSLPTEEQTEWVADNLFFGQAVKVITTVIKAELTEDFFLEVQEAGEILKKTLGLGTATSGEDDLILTNGSGPQSPNLEESLEDDIPTLIS